MEEEILQKQAENTVLINMYNNIRSDIELEVNRNAELLKVQEDMNNYYTRIISSYDEANKEIIDNILNCRENISRLQGKTQNLQYQSSVLREQSENQAKSKKRKSRF
tara:strand:- start:612 stop:932 length:321 start_codon:yes stop_codon:yes gene_type:complete